MRSLFDLFWVFFKIGSFTIGGGYAMLPLIRRELVERKKWVTEDEFLDTYAIAQSSPGPIAVNTAVFLGLKVNGFWGMIATTLGSILPPFLIILLLSKILMTAQYNPYVIAAFNGIKPAVVALILSPVLTLSKKSKTTGFKFLIPVIVALLVAFVKISPIFFIVGAMVVGNIYYRGK